jgi:NAD-dependent SIR2 family protein deacetylase
MDKENTRTNCHSTETENCSTDATIEEIARQIASDRWKRIVVLVGAGISVASGIPDFRSTGGFYDHLRTKGFDHPEEIFSKSWYDTHKDEFYRLLKDIVPAIAEPSTAHRFVKWLSDRGSLVKVITQNIDGLEEKVGICSGKIAAIHGSLLNMRCEECGYSARVRNIRSPPTCRFCHDRMRPDIVFFGEPIKLKNVTEEELETCDALFIIGTSLSVYPCADMIDDVGPNSRRIFVNRDPPHPSITADLRNEKDIVVLGDAQEICRRIRQKVEELEKNSRSSIHTLISE